MPLGMKKKIQKEQTMWPLLKNCTFLQISQLTMEGLWNEKLAVLPKVLLFDVCSKNFLGQP